MIQIQTFHPKIQLFLKTPNIQYFFKLKIALKIGILEHVSSLDALAIYYIFYVEIDIEFKNYFSIIKPNQ